MDIIHARSVDNRSSSTERHACHPRAVDHGGQPGAVTPTLYAGPTPGCPQSTAPTTATNSIHHLIGEKGDAVKFRCEREILADALTTAGRAATNRSGTLPVLSGVRLDVSDGQLTVTGTDLELTIRLSVPVHSDRDGFGGRAGTTGRRHRQGVAGRRGRGRRHRRRDVDQRRTFAVLGAPAVAQRLPGPGRDRRRAGDVVEPAGRRRVAPGGAGGIDRRCQGGAHRRADRLRGRRAQDGRHRLVPTRRARPAPVVDAGRRPEGARARRGRWPSCSACCRPMPSCRSDSAPERRCSRSAAHA